MSFAGDAHCSKNRPRDSHILKEKKNALEQSSNGHWDTKLRRKIIEYPKNNIYIFLLDLLFTEMPPYHYQLSIYILNIHQHLPPRLK